MIGVGRAQLISLPLDEAGADPDLVVDGGVALVLGGVAGVDGGALGHVILHLLPEGWPDDLRRFAECRRLASAPRARL